MRAIPKLLIFCFVLAIMMAGGAAFAESPSEQECDARNGTFDRVQGQVICVVEDPVGNSENSDGKSQTTTDEESSNGTFNNRPHHEESCTGPGGSGEGGGPCKNK
jgi:hypothetical protein